VEGLVVLGGFGDILCERGVTTTIIPQNMYRQTTTKTKIEVQEREKGGKRYTQDRRRLIYTYADKKKVCLQMVRLVQAQLP
jgi:hypothetical protein